MEDLKKQLDCLLQLSLASRLIWTIALFLGMFLLRCEKLKFSTGKKEDFGSQILSQINSKSSSVIQGLLDGNE